MNTTEIGKEGAVIEKDESLEEELESLKAMLDKEQIQLGRYLKKLYKDNLSSFEQLKTELTNIINDEKTVAEKEKWQDLMSAFVNAEKEGFEKKWKIKLN
ncbi:hypothetical protein KKA15_00195 [Patescibacteria group bacterium]|nr:hypothetical protein [Patescibacteria group bacterium]